MPTLTPPRPAARRGGSSDPERTGSRLGVGFMIIAFVASLFAARLIQLQVFDPHGYSAAAAAENRVTLDVPAHRGAIVDRTGQPLAQSVQGLMVLADPSVTGFHDATTPDGTPKLATLLANRLGISYIDTLKRLRLTNSRFAYIARQVPATMAIAAVAAADAVCKVKGCSGLWTATDPVREYPAKDVAANLIGFLGTPTDAGRDTPLAGLELSFNNYLAGKDGSQTFEVARPGSTTQLPLGSASTVPAVDGHDLKLTIDSQLQWYVQRVLGDAVRQAGGDSGYAVVLDSRTGEVLSLADYPTFDASNPSGSPVSARGAASLTQMYEPGSVEKTLTLSSLIDLGQRNLVKKVNAGTKLTVPPLYHSPTDPSHPIKDWFGHPSMQWTLAGVIAQSSNIGTVIASQLFQPGQLYSYLKAFGLGSPTNLGVPGETAGLLAPVDTWTRDLENRIDFGQSVSVNAVQMAAAVNTIARGGSYISPSLIKGSATDNLGVQHGTADAVTRQVLGAYAAAQMRSMMEQVVIPGKGVAPGAQVPSYVVAGKTGTAQRVVNGRYDGSFTVSFAGFAPADKPRFTVYVVVQNPRNNGGGGSIGGPAFEKIMQWLLARYGVPPTGAQPAQIPTTW
ncbi:cell division protein [Nocardioides baekrokdamisoli]|uniref:Cell division protein n=1 Tax=Nocardioides baekrokdamisoli TaxID=1804624 RepID=A0A3G9IX99_9ACTN|nr:penicillin-binding protein 2 [Nocardioides baekrokdamisoli]BBH18321.1 cell division protein [Nocardioides baekrokdamisoli]